VFSYIVNIMKKLLSPELIKKFIIPAVVSILVISWFTGHLTNKKDVIKIVNLMIPFGTTIKQEGTSLFKVFNQEGKLTGYVSVGTGSGYGGNFSAAVMLDTSGCVVRVLPAETRETKAFLLKVLRNKKFISSFLNKRYDEAFETGYDIDAVSGATFTSEGYTEAVRSAVRNIARKYFQYKNDQHSKLHVKFGFAEIYLLVMFLWGYIFRKIGGRALKAGRIVSMILGLIVLGFLLNRPLTITFFGRAMLGYFPSISSDLFWYILLTGTVIFALITGTNPYCYWMCPFSAAQEGINLLTGIRKRPKFFGLLERLPLILSFTAIVVILITNNPTLASYEIFSTLFRLIGSNCQFVLLFLVIITSLFVLRPWCRYLCPVRPLIKVFTDVRKTVLRRE